MDQNNKKETFEKDNQKKQVPNQQNNRDGKAPQQDLKISNREAQNENSFKRGYAKDTDETLKNPMPAPRPPVHQVKHVQ